jgi:hypothetical protein
MHVTTLAVAVPTSSAGRTAEIASYPPEQGANSAARMRAPAPGGDLRRGFRCVAAVGFFLVGHARCEAAVFCLADSAALAAALQVSQGNGEDDELRLVVGTHAPPGAVGSFYFA